MATVTALKAKTGKTPPQKPSEALIVQTQRRELESLKVVLKEAQEHMWEIRTEDSTDARHVTIAVALTMAVLSDIAFYLSGEEA